MFVTVLFGDDRAEVLNNDCKLIHFISFLKATCGLNSADQVELMDSSGTVMKLEGEEKSLRWTTDLLEGRQKYLVVRVCRVSEEECKYVPLLTRTQRHPEFAELLRKLSTDPEQRPGQTERTKSSRNRTRI